MNRNLRELFGSGRDNVRGRLGVRARLLVIVLVSSIALLTIGVGAAAYLVNTGREARRWAELASSTTEPAILMVTAFEQERRMSLLHLAGDAAATGALADARRRSDEALAAVMAKGDAAREMNPNGSAADIEGYNKLFRAVPALRGGIDAHQAPPEEVFGFFGKVIDTIIAASMLAARVAPDAGIAIELGYGVEPLRAAEALSKADTMGSVALTVGELSSQQLTEFTRHAGEFRAQVAYSATVLKGRRLAQLTALTDSPAWRQVLAMQDALELRGPVPADGDATAKTTAARRSSPDALPMTAADYQSASAEVGSALLRLWQDQSNDAHVTARAEGDDRATRSLLGGAAVLLITVGAFVAALLLANRFVRRMRRLRADTLDAADRRLPAIMRKLGDGERVDIDDEVSRLDFGTDELGQVADAFNRAHVAAVSAAAAEATTRAGVNAVFLNIAHRSQVVVHRQLALLDRAERTIEDADQLELLFQLDHLATRARRNAENLIILGGERPGRRWRNPVPLLDLIRGAVAESLDYKRIQTGHAPDVRIASNAVADTIHLLAELMDNATSFSPPQSRVEVSGTVVGKGVVVEIVDQGLGMSEADIAERNAMLADPPDFSVAALSGDTRLGLFVVATLSTRHGIAVRLSESVYGGIRAVVLIPSVLIEAEAVRDEVPSAPREPEPIPEANDVPAGADLAPAPPVSHRSAWFTSSSDVDEPPAARNTDERPVLPRRSRIAPAEPAERAAPPPRRGRTSAQARDLMSAIESGTRQGRQVRAEFPAATTESTRREGDDDHFRPH